MPEYLSPGVYVEETSFRSKSIEGVSTSTAGFVGAALWGPVSGEPELLTSFADFERMYGGLDDLNFNDQGLTTNYLAHAVRAFFEEGGLRLYVSRVFNFGPDFDPDVVPPKHYAFSSRVPLDATGALPAGAPVLVARFPGSLGKMRVILTLRVGSNVLSANSTPANLTQVQGFGVVHVGVPVRDKNKRITGWNAITSTGDVTPSSPASPPGAGNDGLFLAHWNEKAKQPHWELISDRETYILDDLLQKHSDIQIRPITVLVDVAYPTVSVTGVRRFGAQTRLGEFGFDRRTANGLSKTFTRNPATRLQALTIPFTVENISDTDADQLPLDIARDLLGQDVIDTLANYTNSPDATRVVYQFDGGDDGDMPVSGNYGGDAVEFADFLKDPLQSPKNGLLAFESVEDISIVAAPGYSAYPDATGTEIFAIQSAVIDHCEKMQYRIAVLDTPPNQLVSGALDFRNLRSSNYAAMYYPWITIANPLRDERLNMPPSGFVAGIYARNDTEHAVFKAPANEVVRLAVDFEQRLNKGQQDVLNPAGVNCFRFFPGHGFLLWGARTISDDPEWKYVNLRRYFAYLEHSIDRGTQWVVFENNSRQLWDNVRHTIEDFLLNEWKMGGLIGDKPEQAYFVRCDMTTMTQNDLDNGRLVCLIGVAPVRPAEFVIFRIGQWTATSNV